MNLVNLGTEYVKKDKKPSSREQLGMRKSTEEGKAGGKASPWFITPNSAHSCPQRAGTTTISLSRFHYLTLPIFRARHSAHTVTDN